MSMWQWLLRKQRRGSAPIARDGLKVLPAHEGILRAGSDLVGRLREEIVAVICRHVMVEPNRVQVEMDRGTAVSTLASGSAGPIRSKQMFRKNDVVNNLSRDLDRLRDKRDALTSDVTTLTAQIAELEARLSEEKDQRERQRVAIEIETIKKQLTDTAGRFGTVIAELRDATAAAAVIAPEGHELHGLLLAVAAEVDAAIAQLLGDLDRRVHEVCAGHAAPDPLLSRIGAPQPPQNNALLLRLPEWLRRNKQVTKSALAGDQCGVAA